MHGKVWMFSHLIDDEDLAFLQREFVSYQQAMDYYGLGYKPIVRLSQRPERLMKHDFTDQGYLFFAGNIEVAQSFLLEKKEEKRYILRLDRKPRCAVLVIRVNDVAVRTYSGGCPDTDITEYLEEGKNEIVFCFGGTNRNLLGPHHFTGGESFSVGPDTFGDTGGWTEPEELQGKGIWTDSYCFVEFGF